MQISQSPFCISMSRNRCYVQESCQNIFLKFFKFFLFVLTTIYICVAVLIIYNTTSRYTT